jgi:hypothetical protein
MAQYGTNGSGTSELHLRRREIVFGFFLASTSGAAVLAHTFGPVRLSFTAPFISLPSAAILVGIILLRRRLYVRLHVFAQILILGAVFGLLATGVYDAVRPLLKWIFHFAYNPYRAMPIFGMLITGRPESDPIAIAAGWIYHFWNGISFGMMFALLRPKGGAIAGWAWGLGLQCLMMIAYPHLLAVRLADHGFLAMGLVGHSLWGIVLGACLRKYWMRTGAHG